MTVSFQAAARGASAVGTTSRGQLTEVLKLACSATGAGAYMLVETAGDGGAPRIVASNWVYDAVDLLGSALIAKLTEPALPLAWAGTPKILQPWQISTRGWLSEEEAALLTREGFAELVCVKLNAGRQRHRLILSAEAPGRIVASAVAGAQLICSYALSRLAETSRGDAGSNPLSERERECLHWVSEGKTTDEVAVILGVSSNTVNAYVANAIQKFGARNRAYAVAHAIRNGFI